MSVKTKCGAKIPVVANGKAYEVPVEDWEQVEPAICPKSDKQMGSEVCHRFELAGYEPAGTKGVSIDAYVEVWEYPNGSIETLDVSDGISEADARDVFFAEMD